MTHKGSTIIMPNNTNSLRKSNYLYRPKKNSSFLCSILLYFSKMKRNKYTTNHIPALSTYSSNIKHPFQEIPCGNIRSSLIIQEFAWKKQSEQPNKPSLLTNDSTLKLYANN